MNITLINAGRKFNRDWIFRGVNRSFESGKAYSILGPNGSGKSTFIQMLSGYLSPSEGSVEFKDQSHKLIPVEEMYNHLSIASPYLELIEDFSLPELIHFHQKLKPFISSLSGEDVIAHAQLEHVKDKQIKYFSSGMKQRVRLALAILSDVPLVLLDEPCTNLDQAGKDWYKAMVATHGGDRLLFVGSNNQAEEISFCEEGLHVTEYKKGISKS